MAGKVNVKSLIIIIIDYNKQFILLLLYKLYVNKVNHFLEVFN